MNRQVGLAGHKPLGDQTAWQQNGLGPNAVRDGGALEQAIEVDASTSTELPAMAVLSVRPASDGMSSSMGKSHSMCTDRGGAGSTRW